MSTNLHSNPWPGVMSYQIPCKGTPDYKFCGRNRTISSFVPLVKRNSLTTLYGRSGVGKTSFLNAGVFPILQQEGYLPIYIRLGLKKSDDDKTFAQTIVERLTEEMDTYSVVESDWSDKQEGLTEDYLWRYFHTHRFKEVDSEGAFKTPVIILDQAEEIFNYGEMAVSLLLRQLYELLSDNLILPSKEGWFAETTCRFIISIREDYLFYLEDYIDKYNLSLLKENRFRLRPLSKNKAADVVLEPGGEYIKADEREQVTECIVRAALQEDGEVSSLMLSLVCHQLFEQLGDGEKITVQMATAVDTSLQDYYKEAMGGLPEGERRFIENFLVRDERRRRIDYKDFVENVPDGLYLLGEEAKPDFGEQWRSSQGKKFKLLNRLREGVGDGRVEIVHDQFAKVITILKREMELERERERRQKRVFWVRNSVLVMFVLTFLYVLATILFIPRKITLENCIVKDADPNYRNSIYDAQLAESEDGVYRLNNVLSKKNSFRGNRNIRELHIGYRVRIEYGTFDDCPNLETVVFEGGDIDIEYGAFGSQSKIKNIIVKKDARFTTYRNSAYHFNQLENIEVEEGNTQCIVDPTGEALLIRFDRGYDGLIAKEYCAKLPRGWRDRVDNNNYIWCDTINLTNLIRRGYNKDEYWYLVDNKVEHLPDVDYRKGDFCKNVLIADLPHLDSIAEYMFYEGELRTIRAAEASVIGHLAFYGSKHLRKIDFPHVAYTYQNVFSCCDKINEIVLPSLENTYDLSLALSTHLDRIELPNLKILNSRALAFDTISAIVLPRLDSISPTAFWGWVIDSLYINPRARQRNERQLLAYFKEEVSPIDTLCLFVHVGRKSICTLSELAKDNKVLLLNSGINHLIIEKNDTADYQFNEDNYLQKISCSRQNKKYFVFNNALYKGSGENNHTLILVAQNAEQVVLPYNMYKEESIHLEMKDSVKTVVLMNEWDIRKLYFGDRKSDVDILFLSGTSSFIEGLDYLPRNIHTRSMSMIQSMHYLFRYNYLLRCKQYPALPVVLFLFFLLIGIWPILRKRIDWRSRSSMGIYVSVYIAMAIIGWYVMVTVPMLYKTLFLRYVWVVVAYIVAMSTALMASRMQMNVAQILVVVCRLLLLIYATYAILLIINDPADPFAVTRMVINQTMGCMLVIAIICIIVARRAIPLKQQALYGKLRTRYHTACILLIFMDLFAFLGVAESVITEPLFWMSSALAVLLSASLVLWVRNRNKVNKQYDFDYAQYVEMRQRMMSVDIDFPSDNYTRSRARIVNSAIAILMILFYVVFLACFIFEIPSNNIDNVLLLTILIEMLSLSVVDLRLRRKHLKYEDIVKQYKNEEKLIDEVENRLH